MSYWINKHCYKTLENALIAYEEYEKNKQILNGEGLAPLPCNLNLHNHYQEVVPGVIEEVFAYDMLGNKIATWSTPSQIDTRVSVYVGSEPPDAPIGTIYVDIANCDDHTSIAAKDNKNIINCRNCGAPVRSHVCEYCGSHY